MIKTAILYSLKVWVFTIILGTFLSAFIHGAIYGFDIIPIYFKLASQQLLLVSTLSSIPALTLFVLFIWYLLKVKNTSNLLKTKASIFALSFTYISFEICIEYLGFHNESAIYYLLISYLLCVFTGIWIFSFKRDISI